ncbi:hypothetical protein DRP04_13120 [Archaeoglobales archaeon]|nr:MAG: hypothetical protein DRP04_13120 [Archaeoglobales archaeon]
MLLGFSGASGSGKTTLVNELAKELRKRGYNVGIVKEVVREVFSKWKQIHGFNSLREIRESELVTKFQFEILIRQYESEIKAVKSHDLVLSIGQFTITSFLPCSGTVGTTRHLKPT